MIYCIDHYVTPLPNGTTMALRSAARDAVMLCRSGTCWVTEEGVYQDHILGRGDAYRPQGNGTVVVYALANAEMEVDRCAIHLTPGSPRSRWI